MLSIAGQLLVYDIDQADMQALCRERRQNNQSRLVVYNRYVRNYTMG